MSRVEPPLVGRCARGLVHVVDDEDAIRRSLDFMLRAAGYSVERWADGADFLEHADRTAPACVLLDLNMPGIDGLTVQERMVNDGLDFQVIMVTGHADVTVAVRAMRAGAVDFMQKPLERDRILRSVATAFDRLARSAAQRAEQASARRQISQLTRREREVLDGLACGYANKTIATDLGISSRTVEIHRANVMAKMAAGSYADVLRIAFQVGLGVESAWRARHGSDHRCAAG